MIKLSNILLEKEDDGYVSIGFGRFKKKGQEDKDGADVYVKSDKGQYVKTKDQSSDDKESPKGDDSEKKEKPKVNIFDKPKGDDDGMEPDDLSDFDPAHDDPKDNVYNDGEIETIVDKPVDEIKAMLYGKNPLAKYMSYKDDKYIQQHLDALKDTSSLPIGKEDFHRDELFAVMSRAQQNMEMGKVKQGERFSGDRKFLPKSKDDKLKNNLVKGLKGGLEPSKDSGLIKQTLDKLGDYSELKDKIDSLVDDIDNNSVGASEEEMERLEKKEAEVKNDILNALSDKSDKSNSGGVDKKVKDLGDEIRNIYQSGMSPQDQERYIDKLQKQIDFLKKSKKENYNPNDKYLTESIDLLKRDFGQPLPTLQSVMEKHQKNVKEGPDDVRITKKQLQMLIKQEGEFRKRMMNIEQGFLRDPRPENKKLAKDIKKSYKDNVTKFMREVVGMLKRMK